MALAATAFAIVVGVGMERATISSVRPSLAGLAGVPAGRLEHAGYDVFSLARSSPGEVAWREGATPAEAARWVAQARVAALRGIGDANARALAAVGIPSVEALAVANPAALAVRLRATLHEEVLDARVRVWVRAARRQVRLASGHDFQRPGLSLP